MIQVLQFALQSFWHFLGTAILLWILLMGLALVLRAARGH